MGSQQPNIAALYLEGKTLAEIATIFSVSHTTIRNRLAKIGVTIRPRGRTSVQHSNTRMVQEIQ